MANGRLGKANITPLSTTVVYDNTSGAEASVTLLANSPSGSDMYIRIDGTNDAVILNPTLVSETYNSRILRYFANNTTLATGAPTYHSRFAFKDTTTNSNIDQSFEAYVQANTTTYSIKDRGQYWLSSHQGASRPYQVLVDRQPSTAPYFVNWGGADGYRFQLLAQPTDAQTYYNYTLGTSTANELAANNANNYYNAGVTIDPWETDHLYGVAMNTNGYMTCTALSSSGGSYTYNSVTETNETNTWVSQRVGGFNAPTADYNRRNLILMNRVFLTDGHDGNGLIGINFIGNAFTQINTGFTTRVVDDNRRRYAYISITQRRGGMCVFFEYNPVDELHYLCFNQSGTLYLKTINATTALEAISDNQTINVEGGAGFGFSNSTYGFTDITDDLTLPATSDLPNNDADVAYRTTFIGTTASPLWVMVKSKFGSTTASESYYSTDLKTWTVSTSFYTNGDYRAVENDTTIVSNSGAVTATKSAILNIGADGIIEENLNMTQYERTGLVLSNNDRVVVFNKGADNNISFQVMGYEGT
jgi:hypothetical protein